MMDDQQLAAMLRVLVLLDASPPSQAALRAAVALAARRDAELKAVYVEDTNLLRSAAFPFARQLGAATGQIRPIDSALMEAWLQRQRANVEAALRQALVERQSLRHSLEVRRGQVVHEVLSLLQEQDVLVLGKSSACAAFAPDMMGSTCRALAQRAPCMVLVWDERRQRLINAADVLGEGEPAR